jgi:predicted TIM-barrel fold metal-dependent hydrolase
MVITETSEEVFLKTLLRFDEDRVLFGTDSPWTDQKKMLEHALSLKIPDQRKEKMLYHNAAALQRLGA